MKQIKDKRITIRISSEMLGEIRKKAEIGGKKVSQVVIEILTLHLKAK